jgi:Tfp pilus assembly protein PilX
MKIDRRYNRQRRGTVLIVALVAMVVIMAMIGAMLQGTLRVRRQLHAERNLRQCELLLQSGMARAHHRFAKEADYREEKWKVATNFAPAAAEGEVTIRISRPAETDPWQINVVAEYPLGNEHSVLRSTTIPIPIEPPPSQE